MPLFTTDFDGALRGTVWDIGAYEYNGVVSGDTTPPTVSITGPSNNATVSGSVIVTATASDNVGVVGVQFKLDGNYLGTEDTSSPYSINWNTATASNGAHTISATARDAAGLIATSVITVNVNNVVTQPATPVLIAAYSFNEGSGSTSNDTSGKNHTATLNGATWNNTGKYGNSLTFNGTSNYVLVSDANDLDLTSGMTLSTWVYPTSQTNGFNCVIAKEYVYYLYTSLGNNIPLGGFTIGGNTKVVSGISPLPLNTWTYLTVTYNGSVLRLYVNASEVSNVPVTGTIDVSASPLWIGSSNYGEYFPGRMDDVRIYNAALTQAQIQTDMNTALSGSPTTPPPTDTSLKISYALGEGSGGTTADSSGNGHTGTVTGPTWTTAGKYGNALVFDGVNDFVTTPDANDLDFTNGMTLETWVYPTGTAGDWTVISKDYVYYLYACHTGYGSVPLGGFVKAGNNIVVTGTSILPINTWSHLAITYDGALLKLYVNGVNVKSVAATGNMDSSSGPLWLGGNQSYGEYFPGRMDNIRIYNRALTVSEINTNMSTAVTSGQDTTAPIISAVASSNLTSSSAKITWTTDELSNTQVEYGLTTTYGTSSTLDSTLVTSHSVDLTGLSASTLYHYRVKSKDPSNNQTLSSDSTFTTTAVIDSTAPVISGVGTASLTPNSVTINWTTNEASDSQVEYGPTTAYENGSTPLNTALVTSHSVGLTGLTASTLYHYRVKSRDGSTNLATGSDNNFTTAAPPDTSGPTISSILTSNISDTGATITWTTNENSTSVVNYGLTTSYGLVKSDASLVMSHSVVLTGLTGGTLYHFTVTSTDASTNSTTSGDGTFTTQVTPDTTAPVITSLQPSGTFAAGTTQVTLSCITNELATVKYDTVVGTAYTTMAGTFSTTGGTSHSTIITGLTNGNTYKYYIKAQDAAGNANTGDLYTITFSISSTPQPPPPASITVISPNGGEIIKSNRTKTILWSSNGVTTNINIQLIRDGLTTTLFNNIPNSGSANWSVDNKKSSHCRIRIATVDGSVVDTSDADFRIN